jgi:transcriptional regulator with XRE-family HTH domain
LTEEGISAVKHDPKIKVIRDKAFAKRLNAVCDASDQVPPYNYGRLTWFRDQMEQRFSEKVSVESVRKWFSGEVRPRPDKIKKLAQLLKVDEAWLAVGSTPELAPDEKRQRIIATNGGVNLLAGHLMIGGWTVAFPSPAENLRADTGVDVYGIHQGKQYFFSVPLGTAGKNGEVRFDVPNMYEGCVVVGVIPVAPTEAWFVRLTTALIDSHGSKKGSHVTLTVVQDGDVLRAGRDVITPIRDFSELG